MGLLIPSKFGVVLTAHATTSDVMAAVRKAATVEPPFIQRTVKYRKSPGIGAMRLAELDTSAAAEKHGFSTPPAFAVQTTLGGLAVNILIDDSNGVAEARYICVAGPVDGGSAAVVGFPWARALADRTAEFLTLSGIGQHEIAVLKARG